MLFASTMQWKPYRMHNLGESNFALRAKILFLSRVFLEEELWYNWRPRKYIHLGERICLVTPPKIVRDLLRKTKIVLI